MPAAGYRVGVNHGGSLGGCNPNPLNLDVVKHSILNTGLKYCLLVMDTRGSIRSEDTYLVQVFYGMVCILISR